eukprot:5864710-Pleurochrysis_carterae.AAC.5
MTLRMRASPSYPARTGGDNQACGHAAQHATCMILIPFRACDTPSLRYETLYAQPAFQYSIDVQAMAHYRRCTHRARACACMPRPTVPRELSALCATTFRPCF